MFVEFGSSALFLCGLTTLGQRIHCAHIPFFPLNCKMIGGDQSLLYLEIRNFFKTAWYTCKDIVGGDVWGDGSGSEGLALKA